VTILYKSTPWQEGVRSLRFQNDVYRFLPNIKRSRGGKGTRVAAQSKTGLSECGSLQDLLKGENASIAY